MRRVLALLPTSTMWAWPWSSKWVSVAGVWLWLMAVGIKRVYRKFTRCGHHTGLELGKDSFEIQIP
jgi:hypothetical protein